jgi:stage V sporulation protein B
MAKKQSFFHGAIILSAAVAIVKLIGALFKIPLGNLLDGSGMGHFNVAYSVYNVLLVISTAGLPVAVSKMVAERRAKGKVGEINKITRVAMFIFFSIGIAGSLIMFIFAQQFANLMESPNSVHTIRAIAPAGFFVAVMSVFRGYYQGMSNMYPTAVSQVIEALCKLILGYSLAYMLIKNGYTQEIAAAGAIIGVMAGTLLGAGFLLLRKAFDKNPPEGSVTASRSSKELARELLAIAIPITIGSGVLALTNFIDTALVMRKLQSSAGFTEAEAIWMYGAYGLAHILFNFPSSFIVPFSVSVVPAISAAIVRNEQKSASRTIESAMRLTSMLALPAAAGLSVLSGPILNLLFSNRPDEAAVATIPLTILAIAVFFNCVVMLSNSVLQSLGKVRIPVYTMLAGAVVKIFANWNLVGIPEININGAPVGTCLCYLTIMVLNLIVISRILKPAPNILRMFGRPLAASVVMAGCAWACNGLFSRIMSNNAAVLLAICAAVGVYLILVILLRVVTREDIMMLPKGEKIANVLRIK